MRFATAALAALLVTVVSPSAGIRGQIPSPGAGPRFEIAEVRGLADVPARADTSFASSVAGPSFAATTKAVVVKFQSAAPPSDAGLAVAWTKVDGPRATTLASHPVASGSLTSGAYDALTNSGTALAPGRYQVAVVGASGRIYRAIEFTVLAPPIVRAQPAVPASGGASATGDTDETGTRTILHAFGDLEVRYPADYSLSPVAFGTGEGVFFVRSNPSSALFVAYKTGGGRFDLVADAQPYVAAYFRSLHLPSPGVAPDSRALPNGDIGGRPALGRVMIYPSPGHKVVVTVYTFVVEGKNVYAGYIAPASDANVGIEGTAGDTTSGEFFRLVRTVNRRGTTNAPAVEERPAPSQPRERRLHESPGDVALVRLP